MATGRRITRRGAVLLAILGVLVAAGLTAGVVLAVRPAGSDRDHRASAGSVQATVAAAPASSTSLAAGRATQPRTPTTSAKPRPRLTAPSLSKPVLTATPPSTTAASAGPPASRPPSAAATPVGTYPQWLPFHTTMKVGCVKSNCENNYHGYWAIDFETLDNKPGAPVYAAGAGRVRIASQGSGNCGGPGTVENALAVDHGNGVESVYVHLHDFAVAPGTWVTPATVIGHVGSSGYTDPCPDYHLHYELRINGVSVNPGALKACHGRTLVTYPYAIGYSDWNAIPPQEYAGGKLNPKGRSLYSTGADCG